jgi:hydrogenase-4 membrane subunit HyfE
MVQTILHYLGWLGMLLGVVALLFGSTQRGTELLVGGISFIVLKYMVGVAFHVIVRLVAPKEGAEQIE